MNFPEILTSKKQWILWKFESQANDKKPRKVPYYANGHRRVGKQGDEADISNMATYDQAMSVFNRGGYEGLGFCIRDGGGLACLDIDSNADMDQAREIMEDLNSYTEVSPSGNGYHVWVQAEAERTFKNNDLGLEFFVTSQFITMTGNRVNDFPFDVRKISKFKVESLRAIIKPEIKSEKPKRVNQSESIPDLRKAEDALMCISSDCGYDDWWHIAAALRKTFGESAFNMFNYWSSRSSKYDANYTRIKFDQMADVNSFNIETVYKKAIDAGWKPPRDPNWKPEPQQQKTVVEQPVAQSTEQPEIKQKKQGNEFFRFLGYNRDIFYIFQYEKNQICEMKKSDLSETGFYSIAPQQFWINHFGDGVKTFDKKCAADWFIRQCYGTGFYNPDMVRGRGAWWDDERPVFHFGSHLSVSGEDKDVDKIESDHLYEVTKPMRTKKTTPLSKEDGRKILNTAKMFRWQKPASAPLLCGWLFLSRICGALNWRPHVWVTGESGSGKTTIMNSFVYHLLGQDIVFAQGNSTEAGIRQKLNNDALPVLFDEAESNNEREQNRIQNILSLVRQSSTDSGAHTLKGTATGEAMQFFVRSMFMLSSIQVQLLMQADIERITVLNLIPKRTENASSNWDKLSKSLLEIGLDKNISDRLFTRSLIMLPQILKNIDVFRVATAKHFGTVREGDQFGTLLAGCWSMCEDKPATEQDATDMIKKLDWSEYMDNAEDTESKKTLSTILESKMRIPHGEASLFEVINIAVNGVDMGQGIDLSQAEANATLSRNGFKLESDCLLISNNTQSVNSMLKGSQYQADWRGQILRIDGVTKHGKAVRFNGVVSKCIRVDLSLLGL